MFAGKTSSLIRRFRQEQQAGRQCVMVKSAVDTRHAVDRVVAHTGDSVACLPLQRLGQLREALGEEAYAAVEVVAVDEAQFMEDLREGVLQLVERDGKHVVLAGLLGDYKREAFGRMHTLIPLADSVELLAGQCRFCEAPSRFTLRIAASSGQVLVGGAEAYAPVCRRHYVEMHSVREGPLPEEGERGADDGRAL